MKLLTNFSYSEDDKITHFDFFLCESQMEYQRIRSSHSSKEALLSAISYQHGYEFDAIGIHVSPYDGHHVYYIKPGTIMKPSVTI